MPERVSLFIPSLAAGGAQRVMVTLANGLARRSLAVDLVVRVDGGPYRSAVDDRVKVVALGTRRTLSCVLELSTYLRQTRPGVLLSAMNYANVVAIWARELSRTQTRLVVSDHCNLSQAMADLGGARAALLRGAMRLAYPRADAVVAVSNGVADDLARQLGYPRSRIRTCYNPIEVEQAARLAAASAPHPWFAAGEPPVVLAVGRLSREKDFSTLIRAFELLRGEMRARLIIVGDGDERATLGAQIAASPWRDDIFLAGFQANPYSWMKNAKVFVLCSRWEGFGNVLVEAMACETPVVSTDCPSGPAEILENGKWGTLVPVGDVETLARALRSTLRESNHRDLRDRAAKFDVERAVDAYLEVLMPELQNAPFGGQPVASTKSGQAMGAYR